MEIFFTKYAMLFHSHVDMFMHCHILNNNEILKKIQKYMICYELQHCGSIHVHILMCFVA